MANLAEALISEQDPERALSVLNELLRGTPKENVPYTRVLMPVAEAFTQLATTDTLLSPNTAGLSSEKKAEALKMAHALILDLFEQQQEVITYATSLGPEYYSAMTSEVDLALQVNDRILRVFKYYLPEDKLVIELEKRLGEMEEDINQYEQDIVSLGFMQF